MLTSLGMAEEKKKRPQGSPEAIDEAWKRKILERMRSMESGPMTRADLARAVGVTPAAITILFQPETRSTRLKAKIHKALGLVAIEPTPAVVKDPNIRRVLRRWGDLSEANQELVLGLIEQLATKPG